MLAEEPPTFDKKVRQPGLAAIDELVGRPPRIKRAGPCRKKIADKESQIPADKFPPIWRKALDDMMNAYEQRCAYLAMAIERTGSPTVDHVIPKSQTWDRVYEWSNYRLCASVVNSKKGELRGLVDPVDVKVGWFELDLASFRVIRGTSAPGGQHKRIDETLPLLNLRDCCLQREAYIDYYRLGPGVGGIDLAYLERRAPFIAREMRRQGQLVRGDV